jgi:vacuolar-type H+-ATPase subunit H
MEILSLINELNDMISDGRPMPMTSSVLIDKERSLDVLAKMRINVPSAIKEGERMILERDRIIAEARSHAEDILAQANEKAKELVSQEEIMRQAKGEQEAVLEQTRLQVAHMRFDAEQYQLNILRDLSQVMHKVLNEVEMGVTELENRTQIPS